VKKILIAAICAAIYFSLFTVQSCKDEITGADIVFPDTLVSYKNHVQPLFNRRCATPGCHDGTTNGIAPNLTYYEGWRFGPPLGLVNPVNPESSLLVISIEGNHQPPPPLTKNQLNGIKQWIKEGALNN